MLPSLGVRGKESGKWPGESLDSAWALRAVGVREAAAVTGWGKTGRHACSDHGTVRGQARWTPKRQI
ncbi:hypothetical protein CDL15_Pgr012504 [Punica granatum]|uniref:Uncharacterized protein n=1 Tax=Punica granatum TaxID=22663 RepID=A0A218WEP5_PUNGR|nr:hypothetical protein CDL15_Pgr012504 [Punica granatum]